MPDDRRTDVAALLEAARRAGVDLRVEGSRLRFRAQAGEFSDALRRELADHKTELIEQLRAEAAESVTQGDLAANQLGLWHLNRLAPDSSAYNIGFAVRARGPIDVEAFDEALQIMVDRHETLRTEYPEDEGTPRRRVRGHRPIRARSESVDLGEAALSERVRAVCAEPFDVADGPLLRAWIGRITDTDAVILLSAHHLALDGLSLLLLAREVVSLYDAIERATPPPPDSGAGSFGDFVEWQARWLEESGAEAAAYWTAVLQPAPPSLALPRDHLRPGVSRLRGATVARPLGDDLAQAVEAFARTASATLHEVLFAAYFAFLQRLSGQSDLTVGTPIHGRSSVRFAGTLGNLMNMIPVRIRELEALGLTALVASVREAMRSGVAFQDYPLPLMARGLGRGARASAAPFETLFALQDLGGFSELRDLGPDALEGEGLAVDRLRLSPFPFEQQEGQFDLSLDVVREPGGVLGCRWKYDVDLLDEDTVVAWAAAFESLLTAALAEPDTPLEELRLGSDVPRAGLEGPPLDPPDDTAPRRVEARADEPADRPLVSDASGAWSYGEVHRAAARLAASLRSAGVDRGERVGIALERGAPLVVAPLGVWYAGAAFVPLDPTFPVERLEAMIRAAGVRTVIADDAGRAALAGLPADSVRFVEVQDVAADAAVDAGPVPTAAGDLAYVLFTSGSTGEPKGVAVSHGALANFLESLSIRPGLGPDDVLLAVTTLSFDIAILELMLPAWVGARTVVAPDEVVADGRALADWIQRSEATVMQATPASWRMLLDAGWSPDLPFRIFCGGEALTRELADRLLASGAELWNLYGPTETTIWSTVGRVQPGAGPPPLGEPIHNTRLHVVDPRGEPVPLGFAGELWIGGAGLADGYLDDPERTAERFVPEPGHQGERAYRTGDRVRLGSEGRIAYLGRLDRQTKVRGFRVEVAEVEAALGRHPSVRDSAVGAVQDASGTSTLAAWVVPSVDGAELDEAELRAHLAARLPPYMVPTSWLSMESLPLTPNGKVDRASLPAVDAEALGASLDRTPPRTETERELASVWMEVLGLSEPCGIHADFFRLGGHSLLATRLLWAAGSRFGVELPARVLFEAPTVAELALRIDAARLVAADGDERGADAERYEF